MRKWNFAYKYLNELQRVAKKLPTNVGDKTVGKSTSDVCLWNQNLPAINVSDARELWIKSPRVRRWLISVKRTEY